MATADDVRAIALALPHVVERDCEGFDFKVGGKGFVWSYPDFSTRPRVIRDDIAVLYVGDEAEKQALLLGEPDLFFTVSPGYDGYPLVMLRLAKVTKRRLRELITDAWRMRAPADLLAELEQKGA